VLIFLAALFVLSLIFSTSGIPLWNSIFEVGSALTTNGFTMGATNISLPIFYKFVLMVAMIIGRVEIMIVLTSIYVGKSILTEVINAVAPRLSRFIKEKISLIRFD
jgi:Trk-type K+ transport system membrane component